MFDYMINHISAQSPYYKDFLEKKDASEYHDLFIRYKDFWENGEPTEEQVDAIYKRKPRAPYVEAHFADGTSEKYGARLMKSRSISTVNLRRQSVLSATT